MLKIWAKEGPLFRGGGLAAVGLLALFAAIDCGTAGDAEAAVEGASFAVGMGYAMRALSHEGRASTAYFCSLPVGNQRSRRSTLDAGMFWLLFAIACILLFEYAGPAKLLLSWLRGLVGTNDSHPLPAGPIPSLDRLSLPLLGYWSTAAILLRVGLLKGGLARLLDVGVFVPLLGVVLTGVVLRHTWLIAPSGWRHWGHLLGTGCATLLPTWWLARTSLNRIARSGTELATRGVFS